MVAWTRRSGGRASTTGSVPSLVNAQPTTLTAACVRGKGKFRGTKTALVVEDGEGFQGTRKWDEDHACDDGTFVLEKHWRVAMSEVFKNP